MYKFTLSKHEGRILGQFIDALPLNLKRPPKDNLPESLVFNDVKSRRLIDRAAEDLETQNKPYIDLVDSLVEKQQAFIKENYQEEIDALNKAKESAPAEEKAVVQGQLEALVNKINRLLVEEFKSINDEIEKVKDEKVVFELADNKFKNVKEAFDVGIFQINVPKDVAYAIDEAFEVAVKE